MKIVSPEQMRLLDQEAIRKYRIPSLALMENAGGAVAQVALKLAPEGLAVVAAGPGNNGGDGFVAARHLAAAGLDVVVYLVGAREKLTPDAFANCDAFLEAGGRVEAFKRAAFGRDCGRAAVVLDALLGTGSRGDLAGDFKAAAEVMNRCDAPVVAVDIPSGVDARTGEVPGAAVVADITVAFGLPKIGLTQYPARDYAGDVCVADIGYPPELVAALPYEPKGVKRGFCALVPEDADVAALLPELPLNLHKGAAGRAYLLAGSRGLSGAAVLAAKAALRSGAGLVETGLPAELDVIYSTAALEPLSHPLPQTEAGCLGPEALKYVKPKFAAADALGVGPGLGRDPRTGELLRALLPAIRKPVIVDADGLYHLGRAGLKRGCLKGVLTPHPGELARLYDVSVEEVESDRLGWARRLAAEAGMAVILKGYLSVVAAPNEVTWLNPTGNPGLASGGTGDVLTGVVLAFLAAGFAPVDAARAGAYVHGLAADVAVEKRAARSLIAGDVLAALPRAFARLERGEDEKCTCGDAHD